MTRTSSRRNFNRLLSSLLLLPVVASCLALYALPHRAHADVSVSFTDSATNSSNESTYTFSNMSIGSVSSDRVVVVAIATDAGNPTIDSVTIAGGAATIAAQHLEDVETLSGIAYRAVPSGTSATIVVNLTETALRAGIAVYALTGVDGATPYDADSNGGAASASVTGFSYPAGGAVIAAGSMAGSETTDWTNVTEDITTLTENDAYITSASKQAPTGSGGETITLTATGADRTSISVASWAPETDAPTDLTTTSVTGGVSLSWSAPATIGGSNLETYGIWRATSPFTATTSATLIASIATTSTSYSDTSVVFRTNYFYRVTATNASATSTLSNQRMSNANSGRIIRLGGIRLR